MMRNSFILFACCIFSYFVYIDADLNLQENHIDTIRSSQPDINRNSFVDEEIHPVDIKAACDPNPCFHGECFVTGRDGFTCICDGLHTGRFCSKINEHISAYKEAFQFLAIFAGILGALLMISIIISIILLRKLQKEKKKNIDAEIHHLTSILGPETLEYEYVRDEEQERRFNSLFQNNSIQIKPTDKDLDDKQDEPQECERGDNRSGYTGENRMFPKENSSQNACEKTHQSSSSDDEYEPPVHLSRSSVDFGNEKITGRNVLQE